MINLPYLTRDLPGIGGRIKATPDDFQVEEIPLYEPCGRGTHVYFRVIKTGVPTPLAVDRIARYIGVRPGEIGFAGLKDAQAVTSQIMSVEHVEPHRLESFRDDRIRIEVLGFHGNKLRPGHLAGNRFTLKIRGVGAAALPAAQAVMDVLAKRGVPNYFGPQRFGSREDTHLLGEALVRGDGAEFISLLLGRSRPGDPPDCKAARDAFDAGFLPRALSNWPRHYVNERRALSAFKHKHHAGPAIAAVDRRLRRLYVSAFQSAIFNDVLARRIDTIDRIMLGDLAGKSNSGGVFRVEDPAVDQPRADEFDISPTGPIPGYRSSLADGESGAIEREVLAAHSITQDDFRRVGALKVKGARRALRFQCVEPVLTAGDDKQGEFIELRFVAPSGCYASIVLREITKADVVISE